MKVRQFLYVLIFSTLFLFGCNSNNPDLNLNPTANTGTVYATNVSLGLDTLNYYVGDSINLSNINVTILPSGATVKPNFSIDNNSVAVINNNILSFINSGNITLTVSVLSDVNTYKTASVNIFVSEKPIYAESINLFNSNVVLNFNETAFNYLTITPASYNKNVVVEYLVGGIIEYNYKTGMITPIISGSDVVTIKVNKSESETIQTSFNVTVTNNVYATDINYVCINNKEITNTITLFTGESGKLTCNVNPNNYNLDTTYTCSNNLITINNNGEFTVGNIEGNCEIVCSVISKNGVINKSILVNVVNLPTSINFEIKLNNNIVDCLYTTVTYNAFITSVLPDYSILTFTNCNYSFVSDNIYEIVCSSAGETEIKVAYNLSSFIGTYTVYGSKTIKVYNPITNVNFGLFNTSELIPTNNVYTLYLPNANYVNDAINNDSLVYADMVLEPTNINTKPNSLTISVVGDSVKLEDGKVTSVGLGESKLVITSNDINAFTKEVVINVLPLEVSGINVNAELVNLYLNGEDGLDKFNLSYTVEPYYAYNTNIMVSCNSGIVNINNNVVTAISAGTCEINLSCGEISKTITVTVSYVPTNLCVTLNDNVVSNNANIEIDTNTTCYLTAYVYSNNVLLDNEIKYYVNSVQYSIEEISKLKFSEEGNYLIKLESGNLSFEFTLVVKLVNPITSFEFNVESINVNMLETSTYTLNYFVTQMYETKPTSSTLTFESSNENVVKINNNVLTFVGVGSATISAVVNGNIMDTLLVTVISKEVNYISNLSEFLVASANSSASYVVTSNLDFSNFTASNCFNFSGEIDFNGYEVSNLKTTLFNILSETAVVKNLVISGNTCIDVSSYYNDTTNSGAYFALIANENNGTISNISFNNFSFNLTNSSGISSTTIGLVSTSNNGLISDVYLNNFQFNANFSSTKVNGIIFSGLTYANAGVITNVLGTATYAGFTRISGVALNNYGEISNVTLTQTFNCTQTKHQIGALVYKCTSVNGVVSKLININLTTCVVNSATVTFAGFVYSADCIETNNITLNITFEGVFVSSTTYLVYYSKPSSVEDVTNFEIISNVDFNKYT